MKHLTLRESSSLDKKISSEDEDIDGRSDFSSDYHGNTQLWKQSKITGVTILPNNCTPQTISRVYPRPSNGSYLSVQGEYPLMAKTVGQLVDEAAARFGDRRGLFVAEENRWYSFLELKMEIDEFAGGLLGLGLSSKDRIGIWGPNCRQWYIVEKAAAKAGLISVFMNPAYQTRELFYSLNKVGMKAIVMAGIFRSQNYYKLLLESVPEIAYAAPGQLKSKKIPSLTTVITMESKAPARGVFAYDEVLKKGRQPLMEEKLTKISEWIEPDDICNIQFTSGTTGHPKGVMLSHHNVTNNSFLIGKRLRMTSEDTICLTVPMFHCFGSVIGAMTALHFGASIVYPSPGFNASAALKAASEQKCTLMYGTPTMHVDMVNSPNLNEYDLTPLRSAVTAGAICPAELCKKMKVTYGVDGVDSMYGLTEASPIFFQSLPRDDDNLRETTVGYPSEHVEVKLVDQQGRTVPVGTPGEMCVRGYNTMMGYWDDKEKTVEVVDSARWFHTGDLFVMTQTGHARVVGRLKDMIIRGGENIYPREIEDFLLTHSSIVDAQVFGVPDERLGENVAVWIRLKEGNQLTAEQVREYCRNQISHYKIPKYVKFTLEFPKTQSGKVKKFVMRQQMAAELGFKILTY